MPSSTETLVTLADVVDRNWHGSAARVAIRFEGAAWTFAELGRRAAALARELELAGLAPGDRVAILARNCPHYLELYSACDLAGFIAVPLNFRLAAPELERIVARTTPRYLFVEQALTATADAIAAGLSFDGGICIFDPLAGQAENYAGLLDGSEADPEAFEPPDRDECASLVHTSGTTGEPKGAMLTHRSLLHAAGTIAAEARIEPTDDGLIVQPLFHVGARFLYLAHHLAGAAVTIHREFEPAAVWAALDAGAVTTAQLAPTMIDLMLAVREHPAPPPRLRTVFYSSAPMPVPLLRRAIEHFGPVFLQHYGATESGVVTSLLPDQHRPDGTPREQVRLASAGRPARGVEVRLVDDDGMPLAAGHIGEIQVRHPALFGGYWEDPDATAESFQDGWYISGDIGRFDDDGFLYIVDRRKDLIISGGENIYPREVENAVVALSGVRDCAVLGLPDARWGEAVLACVVCEPDVSLDADAVIAHCRARIAGYKKPKRVEFLNELPRLATGKVDKVALRKRFGGL